MIKEIKKTTSILIDATIPNWTNKSVLVIIKVENPAAVVALVMNVALPTFWIVLDIAFILLPWSLHSKWYLFNKKTQLGIPITIIKGGISAVKKVILNPNKWIVPIAQITPIPTTIIEKKTDENDLKNKNIITAVVKKANIIKNWTSFLVFKVVIVLM